MKKRLITLFVPLLLLFMAMVPHTALAKATIPATTDCTAVGTASLHGNGTTYGVRVYVGVVRPTAKLTDSNSFYSYDIQLNDSNNSIHYYPRIDLGEVVNKTSSPSHGSPCRGSGAGAFYYSTAYDTGNTHLATWCVPVPFGDVNKYSDFTIWTTAGEWTVTVDGQSGNELLAYWQWSDVGSAFSQIRYLNSILDHVNGHAVWGYGYQYSESVHSDGSFHDQITGPSLGICCLSPNIYFTAVPAPGNNGGFALGCAYADGAVTCTLNG